MFKEDKRVLREYTGFANDGPFVNGRKQLITWKTLKMTRNDETTYQQDLKREVNDHYEKTTTRNRRHDWCFERTGGLKPVRRNTFADEAGC